MDERRTEGQDNTSGLYKHRARRFRRRMPWPCIPLIARKSGRSRSLARKRRVRPSPRSGGAVGSVTRGSSFCGQTAANTVYCLAALALRTPGFVRSPIVPSRSAHASPAVISHILAQLEPTPSHSCLVRRRTTYARGPPNILLRTSPDAPHCPPPRVPISIPPPFAPAPAHLISLRHDSPSTC